MTKQLKKSEEQSTSILSHQAVLLAAQLVKPGFLLARYEHYFSTTFPGNSPGSPSIHPALHGVWEAAHTVSSHFPGDQQAYQPTVTQGPGLSLLFYQKQFLPQLSSQCPQISGSLVIVETFFQSWWKLSGGAKSHGRERNGNGWTDTEFICLIFLPAQTKKEQFIYTHIKSGQLARFSVSKGVWPWLKKPTAYLKLVGVCFLW